MTKFNFVQKCMYDLCVAGNSYIHIVRNGSGRPEMLLPLDVTEVEIKVTKKLYSKYSSLNEVSFTYKK